MNTIFVTMFFCGAMPLVMPMASLALLFSYLVDRVLILRVYKNTRITMLDGTLVTWVANVLPFAAVFHLFMTIYIYGCVIALVGWFWCVWIRSIEQTMHLRCLPACCCWWRFVTNWPGGF